MENLHPGFLVGLLVFLLLCSAFFSSSETGMLSLNRYRLRHQAKEGHRGAQRASELLAQVFGPDKGAHARSAFGVAQVPRGACVEIELIAEVA